MSGERFLHDVRMNILSDFDGYINNVYVDGMVSNLGLSCNGLQSGRWLVDVDLWEELCKKHKIEVDWVNK